MVAAGAGEHQHVAAGADAADAGHPASDVGQRVPLTLAVVQSGVAMLVGFGLAWSGEQVGLVVGFSAAVLGWIARSQVTPYSGVGP